MRTLIGVAAVFAVQAALACKPELPGAKSELVESPKYALAFRTQPEKIAIGQHFTVELALCSKDGAAAPESVRVDAYMPDHRHGMNYKTVVTSAGAGRYRAEGLMFHMPGRWEYIFEVRAGGGTERLTRSVVLK